MDEGTGSVRAVVNSAELTGIRTAYDAPSPVLFNEVALRPAPSSLSGQDCVRPRHQTPRRSGLAGSRHFRFRSPGISSCSYARFVFFGRATNFRLLIFSRRRIDPRAFPVHHPSQDRRPESQRARQYAGEQHCYTIPHGDNHAREFRRRGGDEGSRDGRHHLHVRIAFCLFAQHSRRQFLTSVAIQLRAFDDTALQS